MITKVYSVKVFNVNSPFFCYWFSKQQLRLVSSRIRKEIDVLINNAGYAEWGLVYELDMVKMQDVFATNVFGATMMAKYASKVFMKQKSGNIINIASAP